MDPIILLDSISELPEALLLFSPLPSLSFFLKPYYTETGVAVWPRGHLQLKPVKTQMPRLHTRTTEEKVLISACSKNVFFTGFPDDSTTH